MFMNFLAGLSVKHLANSHWLQNDIIIKMPPFLFFCIFFSVSQVGAALMGNTAVQCQSMITTVSINVDQSKPDSHLVHKLTNIFHEY